MNRKRISFRHQLPKQEQIFASRWTKPFAPWFDRHYFWTVNRRQAALSVAVGMFCGLMPGPTQMLSALLVAYFLRTNLPIAIITTLYSNPITYMPLYYLAYRIGASLMGIDAAATLSLPAWEGANFLGRAWEWLLGAGKPLLIGVPILGIILAVFAYFAVLWIWRSYTVFHWNKQRQNG